MLLKKHLLQPTTNTSQTQKLETTK